MKLFSTLTNDKFKTKRNRRPTRHRVGPRGCGGGGWRKTADFFFFFFLSKEDYYKHNQKHISESTFFPSSLLLTLRWSAVLCSFIPFQVGFGCPCPS